MTLLIALIGCTSGGTTGYNGTKMDQYFPMDGNRQATYTNEDPNIGYQLMMEKLESPEQGVDRQIWTYEYYEDQTFSLVAAVKWSVEPGGSTQIHAWSGADGVFTTYDPPIDVTDSSGYMRVGDVVETTTGGTTWTSTYVGNEDCPVLWGPEWEGCVHLTLSDGGGPVSSADPATRPFFVGDYWLVTRYMTAWMHTRGFDQKWNLSLFEYDTGG